MGSTFLSAAAAEPPNRISPAQSPLVKQAAMAYSVSDPIKVTPPWWAVFACLIWPVATLLILLEPFLLGSPVGWIHFVRLGPIVVAFALATVILALVGERWSYVVIAVGVLLWLSFDWMFVSFGTSSPFGVLFDLIGLAGAIRSACSRASRKLVVRATQARFLIACVIGAALIGGISYAQSFQCDSDLGARIAEPEQITGIWLGYRQTTIPYMRPVRLVLHPDGTGTVIQGSLFVSRPGGHGLKWLRRGHCMHWAAMIVDYWSQGCGCPQLSDDGQTLTLTGRGPFGVNVFRRRPAEIIPEAEAAENPQPDTTRPTTL